MRRSRIGRLSVAGLIALLAPTGLADEPLGPEAEALRTRYARLEATLEKLSGYLRRSRPEKAELLDEALDRSRGARVEDRLRVVTELLGGRAGRESARLGDAVRETDRAITAIAEILAMLQREDLLGANRDEQARLEAQLKAVGRLVDDERAILARTRRGDGTESLSERQREAAERAGELAESMRGERDSGESEGGDEDRDGERPDDSAEREDSPESAENESSDGEPTESDSSDPSESSSPSQDGPSDPSQSPSPPSPGQEQVESARRKMNRAAESLEKQERDEAEKAEKEALEELLAAQAELEERLRQMREEEQELALKSLESRLTVMLEMQNGIYAETVPLAETPAGERTVREIDKARQLAGRERELLGLADGVLELLRAEGSSVAFPEAMGQAREDIGLAADRLARGDAGPLTRDIEADVIESLTEMLDAVRKELEKKENEKKQQQPGQSGPPSDPSLVAEIAELKMLRSLQNRVRRRTTRLVAAAEEGPPAETLGEIREGLRGLADRQGRIESATYDLATGRNR